MWLGEIMDKVLSLDIGGSSIKSGLVDINGIITNEKKVILNEESTSFIWCDLDEFIKKTKWYGNKTYLKKVLSYALQRKIFFKKEEIEEF